MIKECDFSTNWIYLLCPVSNSTDFSHSFVFFFSWDEGVSLFLPFVLTSFHGAHRMQPEGNPADQSKFGSIKGNRFRRACRFGLLKWGGFADNHAVNQQQRGLRCLSPSCRIFNALGANFRKKVARHNSLNPSDEDEQVWLRQVMKNMVMFPERRKNEMDTVMLLWLVNKYKTRELYLSVIQSTTDWHMLIHLQSAPRCRHAG